MVKLAQKEFPKLYLYHININDTPCLQKDFQYFSKEYSKFLHRNLSDEKYRLMVSSCFTIAKAKCKRSLNKEYTFIIFFRTLF